MKAKKHFRGGAFAIILKMKAFYFLSLLFVSIGIISCTPEKSVDAKTPEGKWLQIVVEGKGTPKEACEIMVRKPTISQWGSPALSQFPGDSIKAKCQKAVADMQKYSQRALLEMKYSRYSSNKTVALVCFKQSRERDTVPLLLKSNGSKVEEVNISPYPRGSNPRKSWRQSAAVSSATQSLQKSIPQECPRI